MASSGDQGATDLPANTSCCFPFPVNSWPSGDPLVTSMGGTQLHLDDQGNRIALDEVWNDGFGAGGGGVSSVFGRPDFQEDVARVVDGHRGTPDISMGAAVDGGVELANKLAGHRLGYLNPHLYELGGEDSSGIVDITKGNSSFTFCASSCGTPQEVDTTVVGFPATKSFNLASGWGTVNAARFVPALAEKGEDKGG